MYIGENIRQLRIDRGYSQTKFANALNVTQGAVSQWEKGLTSPDVNQLATIARLFNVSTDFLLFGTHPNFSAENRNVDYRLRALMSMRKIDYSVLSESTGIPTENLRHYCSGAYTPEWSEILKLAKALDVSADYLLGRIDDPRRSPNIAEAEESAARHACQISEQDLKFALFDGDKDITDEQFEEVKQFAKAVLTRDRFKKS